MKLQVSFKYKHAQMIEYFGLLFGPIYMLLSEFVSIIFSENVSNIVCFKKKIPSFLLYSYTVFPKYKIESYLVIKW